MESCLAVTVTGIAGALGVTRRAVVFVGSPWRGCAGFQLDHLGLGDLPDLIGLGDAAPIDSRCFHGGNGLIELDLGQPEVYGMDRCAPSRFVLLGLTIAFLLLPKLGSLECLGESNDGIALLFGLPVSLSSRHVDDSTFPVCATEEVADASSAKNREPLGVFGATVRICAPTSRSAATPACTLAVASPIVEPLRRARCRTQAVRGDYQGCRALRWTCLRQCDHRHRERRDHKVGRRR